MKLMKHLALIAAGVLLAASGAVAQTNPTTAATQPARDGNVVTVDRPAATDAANSTAASLRPELAERPKLPPEVLTRLERFKLDAHAYLLREQELKKRLQGANDKDRATIRDQIRDLQERWQERAKELRKDYKERQAELSDKLTEYRELLNDIRSSTLKDGQDRPRRGDD